MYTSVCVCVRVTLCTKEDLTTPLTCANLFNTTRKKLQEMS